MKQHSLFPFLWSILIILAAVAAGCSQPVTASASPDEVVNAFYRWYLGYPGNVMVDRAYHDSEYLTAELKAEVDGILDSFSGGGYDPFLCAQDIPDSITVSQPIASGDTATVSVNTSFPGHGFEVVLSMAQDGWQIVAINCNGPAQVPVAPEPPSADPETGIPADWQVLRDEEYGFEIWYPADWSAEEIPLRNPELDAPMVRMVQILPAEWAAQMNLGGPPDPNNNVVAPISLEISVGSLEEYRRLYYEMPLVQEVEINGTAATLEQDEPSDYQVSRYVFHHPAQNDLRVTLVDLISGFPERAAGNDAIVELMNQVIATFSFID
jgi:hypothetical protein